MSIRDLRVKEKWSIPSFLEKPLNQNNVSVPETNPGGQVENTKALERTAAKELGKLQP